MGIFKEFREFAMRGNAMDMAIGIIMGAAFGKIISSFVSDVLMPPIGLLIGGVNFTDLKIELKHAVTDAAGNIIPAVTLNFGNLIQAALDFLIIAFAIFLIIKSINRFHKKKADEPSPQPGPTKEETLLTEIRDLLKEQRSSSSTK